LKFATSSRLSPHHTQCIYWILVSNPCSTSAYSAITVTTWHSFLSYHTFCIMSRYVCFSKIMKLVYINIESHSTKSVLSICNVWQYDFQLKLKVMDEGNWWIWELSFWSCAHETVTYYLPDACHWHIHLLYL
jgi:hypothetical protein